LYRGSPGRETSHEAALATPPGNGVVLFPTAVIKKPEKISWYSDETRLPDFGGVSKFQTDTFGCFWRENRLRVRFVPG
jgi:hypothetical protein